MFTENFDYQDDRVDFVHGVLTSDLLGKSMQTAILSDGYASRVTSPAMYDATCRDILQRWAYPLVPDNNWFGLSSYGYLRGNVYKEKDVILGRFVD